MPLSIGDTAPSFTLKATDNSTKSLEELKGSGPFAVIFSCNHCPYVLAWEDRIIQLAKDYEGKVNFALICSNDPVKYPADSFEQMQAHYAQKGFPFYYLHDDTQETATAYQAERTPEVFLFDSDSRLAYHGKVDDNYDNASAVKEHYLKDAIEAVLSGANPNPAQTEPAGCTIKWK